MASNWEDRIEWTLVTCYEQGGHALYKGVLELWGMTYFADGIDAEVCKRIMTTTFPPLELTFIVDSEPKRLQSEHD